MADLQSVFRGCLLGLAVGDAMGYTVDSKNLEEIRADYGPNGLLGYDLVNGYADVTSYTQLAAFTANGLLLGLTRKHLQGRMAAPIKYIALALKEWARSQHYCEPERNYCWLSTVPQMKRRRCMDTWMLSMLSRQNLGTMDAPVSRSDHPAPLTEALAVALLGSKLELSQEDLNQLSAEATALTHGPDASLAAAALTYMFSRILENSSISMVDLVHDTMDAIQLQFGSTLNQTAALWELLLRAQSLASSEELSPMDAMEQLSCRTAPEVLAGAVYACITSRGDFDTAMIIAVNHSGRSAAVGAVTGALLGAKLGFEALPDFYLESLEPTETLLELSEDLLHGCPAGFGGTFFDDDWDRKYLHAGQ
jgi:ADP-ribosylglycohydrolase